MSTNSDFEVFLRPGSLVDSAHPVVVKFAQANKGDSADPGARAVSLYYAVRDQFRYDPYALDLSEKGLSASHVIESGHGWCVTKAALLAAVCRAVGIPARLGYADVRNHLSTERMRKTMNTDVFYWHGYTDIRLDGKWVKATPAFNIELCTKFKLKPLEFDGREDSIYHPFDLAGNRHMEYLNFRGEYADVPVEEIRATFAREYSHISGLESADFDQDVKRETAG